ncbi:sensor histidine kinase [Neptuniibacter caesariensis]|uniref:histidine kinase n=1 Tax=Neptuniibacter caesariensis TaxID=207954 RepID=A0A7U8C5Z0_NEPCE|nr:HAMP domain-containing sensor histidine kinase [Neptuniibacter caesariensis]EAR60486.1 sensor histidine kinase [Oceanospirillum sp. MED92] [Neptuniibacter caesariensis]
MKKTLLLLICLIVLPLVFLTWYSVRLEDQQQALLKHQITGLIETQLSEIDQQFQTHFLRLESALNEEARKLEQAKDPSYQLASFRSLIQSSPYVEHLFLIDGDGTTLYPQASSNSRSEQSFLSSTLSLRQNNALFTNNTDTSEILPSPPIAVTNSATPFSAKLRAPAEQQELQISQRSAFADYAAPTAEIAASPTPDSSNASLTAHNNTPVQSGWIAWYNNSRLQHIYWRKDANGNTLGFSLNNARLLSDLINLLPDEQQSKIEANLRNVSLRMINSRGETSYEWGGSDASLQLKPIKTMPLSHPLGSWKLEYRSPGLSQPTSDWLSKVLILITISLSLVTLAWIIYREQSRAARLAEQRVNFVNQVSHELKTPLTNVRMYAEMLEKRIDPQDSKLHRYISVIDNESQRLTRLIENVLSFSRMERSESKLDLQPGKIGDTIHKVVEAFKPSFDQHGIDVKLKDNGQQTVFFDHSCLEQVINNLLSNCEKYASDSQTIEIKYWRALPYSYIEVSDQGPGIPDELRNKIFVPFYRISNKLTDGVSGTGIGLSISKQIAQQHGGDLYLCPSESGACFQLKIKTDSNKGSTS